LRWAWDASGGKGSFLTSSKARRQSLDPNADAFIPDYDPEEIQGIAIKLYQKAKG
jgi:hypothetical protein